MDISAAAKSARKRQSILDKYYGQIHELKRMQNSNGTIINSQSLGPGLDSRYQQSEKSSPFMLPSIK
jgi:hypothetical protein